MFLVLTLGLVLSVISVRFPLPELLLVGVLGVVTAVGGYVLFHSFRLSERVRARTTGVEGRPRMPPFLLPAGVGGFVVMAVIIRPASGPNSVSTLVFAPGFWALGAAGAVGGIVAAARPRLFPSFESSADDRAVAAVSTTVFLLGTFLPFWVTGTVEESLWGTVLALAVLTVLSLAFWVGPPVFLGDRSLSDRERLKTGLKRSGAVAVVSFALGAVPVVYGSGPYPPLWELYLSVFTATMVASAVCALFFAVVLPFRLH